ncbi:hypothetical protein Tsubulata_022336 [Turnera subulata]|uniref:DUF547 domain-containing protein n=1 Tax=Turnera subulata TaxID=218843 RepID=A0A9Q0JJV1_9ROSI|nr:hypothetical protein Tsubulata_022336 [Turnera subulata]
MLCLKSPVLDDPDDNIHSDTTNDGGFVLPINFGSSFHKYVWKGVGRVSSRSLGRSADGSPSCSSISDFEDMKPKDRKRGKLKGSKASLYKCQLEQDVQKLQQQLQDEIALRLALAGAVENSDSSLCTTSCQLPDKRTQDLLDSIASLEVTVSKLEEQSVALQYQLSQERNERRLAEYRLRHSPCPPSPLSDSYEIMRPCSSGQEKQKIEDNQPWKNDTKQQENDAVVENQPNQISEQMVLCMKDIFLCLADPSKLSSSQCMASPSSPLGHLSYASLASFSDSPVTNSVIKSPSADMEHDSEVSSARYCKFDPYGVPGKVDWTVGIGTYSMAGEVSWLSVGRKELEYASEALKNFRSLVEQLADIDPSCLSCSQKLAFWINVYNALIMHALLAYGVPKSEIKLFSLMQKAAYTIGGHRFSAADIEYNILKMKPPAHRPQIALVLVLQKFKVSEELKKFCIDQPEPLLAFALSCGMYSSPAVRIFRPQNVNEQLHLSLKDYVQASVGISNKNKLLVPKLLYCFAKGLVDDSLLPEWICQYLTPEQAAMVRACSSKHKWRLLGARSFCVLPFDSRFRYLYL